MNLRNDSWYLHGWLWAVLLIPVSAVLVGIIMITAALYYPDDVVADTYYRDGKAINRIMALDDEAVRLGLHATLQLADDQVSIRLNRTDDTLLRLHAFHVTDSRADRSFDFLPGDPDDYRYEGTALQAILRSEGIWYLELRGDTNTWRLRTRVQTPAAATVGF